MTRSSWQPGPAQPQLDPGTVDVWLIALDRAPRRDALSAAERERAARFLRVEDRDRWIAARTALRTLLGAYAGADPRALRFAEGPHGKPALANDAGGLRFNLSHSAGTALVAVALGREVGVDVELPRRAVEHVALARRVLCAAEADRIAAIEDAGERERAFLRAWVRWEAVLKCRGTGIGGAGQTPGGSEPWVADLHIDPPAAAALAVEHGPLPVRTWRWPPASA
jgi:4'-phosphopantetheinyl transferase